MGTQNIIRALKTNIFKYIIIYTIILKQRLSKSKYKQKKKNITYRKMVNQKKMIIAPRSLDLNRGQNINMCTTTKKEKNTNLYPFLMVLLKAHRKKAKGLN